jgi:hypothetical protein
MTTNSTSVPDLKLAAYVGFARSVFASLKLKTPALRPVLDAFTSNVTRLQNMLLLPTGISFYSARLQNQADRAELKVTGTVGKHIPVNFPQPVNAEVVEMFKKFLVQEAEEDAAFFGASEDRKLAAVLLGFKTGELSLGRDPDINLALQAELSSYITAMWTIFESLAGDLWETAVNHMPAGLAELQGKRRYKRKGKPVATDDSPKGERTVHLRTIREYGWDTRGHMGSILKDRFSFTRLQGIKDAYQAAFYRDSDSIDAIIQSDVFFKQLSALRNMIVHRSGIADDEYIQRTRETAGLPDLQRGEKLRLDGKIIADLLSVATTLAGR